MTGHRADHLAPHVPNEMTGSVVPVMTAAVLRVTLSAGWYNAEKRA
jgi:hypothetical protein